MKRVIFLMLMLASAAAFAQKQQKPNITKALKLMQEGKLNEAKDMIDAATTYDKTMNDGKTWYYRGLIYASLDTTSNETFKALDPDPLKVALESFKKADEMNKSSSEYFTMAEGSIQPTTQTQQIELLANYYLNKGINTYQDDQDLEGSLAYLAKTKQIFENNIKTYPNDTLTYYVEALVANQAEKTDLAIASTNKYLDKGGKSKDAFLILYQIFVQGPREDKAKALDAVRRGRKTIPSNPDLPKLEIGLLIDMKKTDEAKKGLEETLAKEPDNKVLHFYLGYINSQMADIDLKKADSINNAMRGKAVDPQTQQKMTTHREAGNKFLESARKSYEQALKLDPAYFEAQFYLANTHLIAVDRTSRELSNTGNTAKDSKRRSELVQQRVKDSENSLPYLEKAEKMKAPDKDTEIEVLQKLALLYYYTADDKNAARVAKKLKDLGVED